MRVGREGQTAERRCAMGAILMLANLPFTLLVTMPVNRILKATPTANAGDSTRVLLGR